MCLETCVFACNIDGVYVSRHHFLFSLKQLHVVYWSFTNGNQSPRHQSRLHCSINKKKKEEAAKTRSKNAKDLLA